MGQGHHAIDILRSSDVLITKFDIKTPVLHDLSTGKLGQSNHALM